MNSRSSALLQALLVITCCWVKASAATRRKLHFFSIPQPTVPDFSSFQPPAVGAAVGVGAGVGASVAFTDPAGNCNSQAITSAQGLTAAFGPATATVNGGQAGTAGCSDNAAPGSISTSVTNGFVTTGSLGFGDGCQTNTFSDSTTNSAAFGSGVFSNFGGDFGGSSGCLGRRRLRHQPI